MLPERFGAPKGGGGGMVDFRGGSTRDGAIGNAAVGITGADCGAAAVWGVGEAVGVVPCCIVPGVAGAGGIGICEAGVGPG